ncbi:MAG: nuclear transport factor 2 family protein, partial [Myxococcota bacterium]
PALRWLVDRAQLRDLLAQWALGMDERDEPRVRACVTDDFCEGDDGDADAFARRARTLEGFHSSTHFLGAPAIALNDDRATVDSCALVTLRELGEPRKHPVLGLPVRDESTRSVRWCDQLVRTEGRWWLAERGDGGRTLVEAGIPPETTDPSTHDLVDRELIRDAIARSALEFDCEQPSTNHLVGNQEIDIRGDEARVRSYVYRTQRLDDQHSRWSCGPRHRYDRLERRDGDWQIVERREVDLLANQR